MKDATGGNMPKDVQDLSDSSVEGAPQSKVLQVKKKQKNSAHLSIKLVVIC